MRAGGRGRCALAVICLLARHPCIYIYIYVHLYVQLYIHEYRRCAGLQRQDDDSPSYPGVRTVYRKEFYEGVVRTTDVETLQRLGLQGASAGARPSSAVTTDDGRTRGDERATDDDRRPTAEENRGFHFCPTRVTTDGWPVPAPSQANLWRFSARRVRPDPPIGAIDGKCGLVAPHDAGRTDLSTLAPGGLSWRRFVRTSLPIVESVARSPNLLGRCSNGCAGQHYRGGGQHGLPHRLDLGLRRGMSVCCSMR